MKEETEIHSKVLNSSMCPPAVPMVAILTWDNSSEKNANPKDYGVYIMPVLALLQTTQQNWVGPEFTDMPRTDEEMLESGKWEFASHDSSVDFLIQVDGLLWTLHQFKRLDLCVFEHCAVFPVTKEMMEELHFPHDEEPIKSSIAEVKAQLKRKIDHWHEKQKRKKNPPSSTQQNSKSCNETSKK